ncbi:lmo0937 family membrane protein [Sphingomonas sp.]
MLWTIAIVILLLWLLGFSLDVAGGLIHLLLVIALIVIVVQFLRGRSGV